MEGEGSFLSGFGISEGKIMNLARVPLVKMRATFFRGLNPRWSPSAMLEMSFFNGLVYNAAKYIVSGSYWVGEFTNDVILMIWPMFNLQIQDGHQFSASKGQFFKISTELSY